MGSRHWDITGVSGDLQLGVDGPRLIDNGGVVQVRNAGDTDYARLKAAPPTDENDVVTLKYLRTRADVVVTGQINGGAPPAAGVQGRVYICTTTGGAYTVNRLYYDTGAAWEEIPEIEGLVIKVSDALSGGAVEFLADHIYLWDADGGAWVDGGPSTLTLSGVVQRLSLDLAFGVTGTLNVGSALDANDRVLGVRLNVTQAFDGAGPSLTVGDAGDADRFMAADECDLTEASLQITDASHLYSISTQVTATLAAPGASQGAASLIVLYAQA